MTPVHIPMEPAALREMGVLQLAHVGDAVYELMVRTHLAKLGALRPSDMHRKTVSFVAAPAQAAAAEHILPLLSEEETALFRRARNARVHGCPAGCTPAQYHTATALEALFGWLWLSGRRARAEELFAPITEQAGHP